MKDFIVKHNIWFGGKQYFEGEVAPFDISDPELIKIVDAGHLEATEPEIKSDPKTIKKGKNK